MFQTTKTYKRNIRKWYFIIIFLIIFVVICVADALRLSSIGTYRWYMRISAIFLNTVFVCHFSVKSIQFFKIWLTSVIMRDCRNIVQDAAKM